MEKNCQLDFVYLNAKRACLLPAKRPAPVFVDDEKGTRHLYAHSGRPPWHVMKSGFGRIPDYLQRRNCALGRPPIPDFRKFYLTHAKRFLIKKDVANNTCEQLAHPHRVHPPCCCCDSCVWKSYDVCIHTKAIQVTEEDIALSTSKKRRREGAPKPENNPNSGEPQYLTSDYITNAGDCHAPTQPDPCIIRAQTVTIRKRCDTRTLTKRPGGQRSKRKPPWVKHFKRLQDCKDHCIIDFKR